MPDSAEALDLTEESGMVLTLRLVGDQAVDSGCACGQSHSVWSDALLSFL